MIESELFMNWATHTAEPLLVTDAEGRTLWINDAFHQMCGYTLAELAGERPGHILRGEMTDRDTEARIREALSAHRPCKEELLNYRKDGSVYRAELSITPVFDTDDRITNFIAVARERTEYAATAAASASRAADETNVEHQAICAWCRRVRVDGDGWQQIEAWVEERTGARFSHTICTGCRSRVMQPAATKTSVDIVRLCDEFLMLVSHELRTPLTPIIGWASMMLERDDTSDLVRRAFEVIRRNALQQQHLVEDLLDLTQAYSGSLKLERQKVNLREKIERATFAAREEAAAKGVTFDLKLGDANVEIMCDRRRLRKIVSNITSNAVKFTPQGGGVEVRLDAKDDLVEIVVSDSGIGIAPDFLPHAFDPFTLADRSTTREHGGAGIGLAVARYFTELHGGTIDVHSANAGATFVVRLPRM